MKISKKEGPRPASRHAAAHFQQRPPQAAGASPEGASPIGARHATAHLRLRFRNIPAGIYENTETGKVIVIISDTEYYLGHIRIRNNKYKYASWRQGKKIKEKYLGTLSTRP